MSSSNHVITNQLCRAYTGIFAVYVCQNVMMVWHTYIHRYLLLVLQKIHISSSLPKYPLQYC